MVPEIAMFEDLRISAGLTGQVARQAEEKGEEFIDYDPEDLFCPPGVALKTMED